MTVLRQFFRRCLSYCWTALAVSVILFAFMVSISRMLIPLLADYKENFEAVATEQLGRSVSIDGIDAEWIGLWPRIHLSGVDIQGVQSTKPWISIADVWLSVDLLSLLTKGHLDAERVRVNGLHLYVHRKKEAVYLINKEPFRLDKSSSGDQSVLLKWVFSRDRLQLSNSGFSYSDDRYGTQLIGLSQINLSLENDGLKHHAYGRISIPGERASDLNFVMDMHGDLLKPQEVINHFYLKGDVTVSENMRQWAKPLVDISEGDFFLQLWGRGHLYQLEQVKANISADELKWSLTADADKQDFSEIKNINANVHWRRAAGGWSLDVEDFSLMHAGDQWPASGIHLTYQEQASGLSSLEGSADFLRLQDLSKILSRNLPDSVNIKQSLTQLKARGDLNDVRFFFSGSKDRLDELYFKSRVSKLGYDRWKSLPGASYIDGEVIVNRDKGVLKLDSKEAVLDFGDLFPKPIQVKQLGGNVYWQQRQGEVAVSFDGLNIVNDHVQAQARASITIPLDGASTFMDMQVDFQNGSAKHATLYIPRILSEGSQSWLDAAFVSGRVPSGRMLYHGKTEEYPFENNKGTFIVDFDVKNAELNYGQAWPNLEGLDARVIFKDNSLKVSIEKAKVMNIKALPSIVTIRDLNADARLTANMKFKGQLQQLVGYMHDSPIGEDARDFLKSIKAGGDMNTAVLLKIPLQDFRNFYLKGTTGFLGNKVVLQEWNQVFDEVSGKLNYEYDKGHFNYSSDQLKTRFHGKQASIRIKTIRRKASGLRTTATLKARLPTASLISSFMDVEKIIQGESDWKIALNFDENKQASLQVSSNLKGTAITLPDGFSKKGTQEQSVHLQMNMLNGEVGSVYFNMDGKLKSAFKLTPDKQTKKIGRAEIVFGDNRVKIPEDDGIRIKGYLKSLSPDKWSALFPDNKTPLTDASVLSHVNKVNLSIGAFKTGHVILHRVKLNASGGEQAINMNVDAAELSGDMTIPYTVTADQPIIIRLKHLSWATPEDKAESDVIDPRKLPSVELQVDKFELNKKLLGAISLKVRQDYDGLYFDEFLVKGAALEIQGQGSWLFKESWHESKFGLNIKSPRIDHAMALFDFSPSIKDGSVEAQLQAVWAGPPHWFEMKRVEGTVYMLIKKGRLSDVDPGSGRLFGLLNVDTLRRRLSLDFSDLFKKGFGFDKIEGNFSVSDGDAYTNDLYLDGPAAKIDIQGRIGLATEDYDEIVLVTPKLSSTIPVLGLAAGPQVAVGLFLTEKLFRKKINKLSVTRYSVTGSWEKPLIEKIEQDEIPASEPVEEQ